MVTAYSPILKLALPVQGELSGTWGDVVNDNITSMVEQAIAGRAVIDTWTTDSHTLTTANGTTSESRCAMLELTDTGTALTGAGTVICPAASKIYIVKNDAGQNITVKTVSGTGILVPDGRTTFLFCDGTNVVEAMTHTTSLQLGTSTVVTAVLDEDNMASDSATSLATQQSIKAYVDAQVGANNELSEVLANGNTSGANDIIVDNGQKITVNTIDETTADSGVTIDSVLLKDDGVNATNLEVTNIKANDGTAAGSIADSTGVVTVASAVLTTADINGGTADDVIIGGTTPAAATVTTATANTSLNIAGTVTVTSILDEDNMASDDPAGLATQQSIKAYVDAQVGANNELSEVLANGNTTGGTDIAVSTGDDITFADSSKAIFGAGSDLQIYHDGVNSYIDDTGTGNLVLRGNSAVSLQKYTGETLGVFNADGPVNLFYDNAQKFATTATGIDVTGTAVTDGLTSSGALSVDAEAISQIKSGIASDVLRLGNDSGTYVLGFASSLASMDLGASDNFRIRHGSVESFRATPSGVVLNEVSNANVDFRVESDGNANMLFVDAGNNEVGVGTSNPDATMHVYGSLTVGKSGVSEDHDLKMWPSTAGRSVMGFRNQDNYMALMSGDPLSTELFTVTTGGRGSFIGGLTVNENSEASEDFRVESDSKTHMLFVDASSNKVGIGASSPQTILEILDSSPILRLEDSAVGSKRIEIGVGSDSVAFVNAPQSAQTLKNSITGTESLTQYHNTSGVVVNESGADRDFRVESDSNTHALFVDAGDGKVKINSTLATDGVLLVKGADALHPVITVSGSNSNGFTLLADRYQADESILNLGMGYSGANPTFSRSVKPSTTTESAFISSQDTFAAQPAALEIKNDGFRFYHTRTNATTATDSAVALTSFLHVSGDGVIANDAGIAEADFRVESDSNANMLFVDGGNNKVIVGSSNIPNINGSSPRVYELVLPTGVSIGDSNFTHGYIGNAGTDGNIEIVANAYPANLAAERYVYIKTGSAGGGGPNLLATFANGIGSVFNDDGASGKDFRVESDSQSHMLFVDASTGNVGIHDSEPTSTLTVQGNKAFSWNANGTDNVATTTIGQRTLVNNQNSFAVAGTTHNTYYPSSWVVDSSHDGSTNSTFFNLTAYGVKFGGWTGVMTLNTSQGASVHEALRLRDAEAVFNEQGNNTDFRVESDTNANALFVDAATADVYFGASSSTYPTNANFVHINEQSAVSMVIGGHSGTHTVVQFRHNGANTVGSIVVDASSTSYNTSSDYRLKENVIYDWDATTRLKQLKPARFNFIGDADTTVDGFLAHEAQAVVPEAVHGTHNQVDDDGVAVMQGIDQSKLVPLLVKTIQELEARIAALETP